MMYDNAGPVTKKPTRGQEGRCRNFFIRTSSARVISIRNLALAGIILTTILAVSTENADAAQYVRTYQVSAGADDGYSSAATSQDISGLLFIGDGSVSAPYYMTAARFTGVNIPRSASVTNAVLKIQSTDQNLSGTVYGQIRSEASDDSADFISRYIASASLNSAAVTWDHSSTWTTNTWYTSPDISSVVQPVFNRTGWYRGNDLTIFYRTRSNSNKIRSFASFNSSPAAAPVLEVTYQVYRIWGHVRTVEGTPVEGVIFTPSADIEPTVSDASGYYELLVPPLWADSLTISKPGWYIYPNNIAFSQMTSDLNNFDIQAFQPHITGNVRTNHGSPMMGIQIAADGGYSGVTDASGNYDVSVPYEWTGTIRPVNNDWSFTPGNRWLSYVTTNIAGIDFTGSQPTISGYVTDRNGNPRQYVYVSTSFETTPTDSSGYYSLPVPYHWSGNVHPTLSEWGFNPAGRDYTDLTASQTNQNYTVFQPRIRGTITSAAGGPIQSVPILMDGSLKSTSTDAGGHYEWTVIYGWSGTIFPWLTGWTFDPGMRSYSNVTADQNEQDYTGHCVIISGYITERNGAGVPGAAFQAVDGEIHTSGPDGYYWIRVPYNWSGAVTISGNGWVFEPPNRTYDNLINDQPGQNYTGIRPYIRGSISMLSGGPAAGITVSADSAGSSVTDSNGFYEIKTPYGWSGTVTPNYTGLYFMPSMKTYISVIEDQNSQDYIAKTTPYSGGTGTPEDPYQITTVDDLNNIGSHPEDFNKCFIQTSDIDLAQFAGPQFKIIGSSATPFKGVFDGNGHTVSNFKFNSNSTNYVGLFGYINGARISSMGLVEPNVVGSDDVGALVGINYEGTLTQCWVRGGFVNGNQSVGGLAGESFSTVSVIRNCYAQTEVLGQTRVGGLVGSNWGSVFNSYSTGPVNGNQSFGGLIGYMYSNEPISGCFWNINTSGQSTSPAGIGKTTAQMKTMFTYVSWPPLWNIQEGIDYPHLLWEGLPGDVFPANWYAGGTGTTEDPYIISTAEHLAAIGYIPDDWGKNFRLDADIDCTEFEGEFQPIGNTGTPFNGIFDGSGHTISNLIIDSNTTNFAGLFGYINEGQISCLGLIDPDIRGADNVGALVGYNHGGALEQCWVRGGVVAGDEYVGGLVGYNDAMPVLKNCYAQTGVTANIYAGGFLGGNNGSIADCYSTGYVAGTDQTGGFTGYNGGIAYGCFWDINTSGQSKSAAGMGKTTAEMKQLETFLGWGCQGVDWTIDNGNDYPRVLCENAPGQLIEGRLSDYLAGSGTAEDPYKISDYAGMNLVGLFDCEWDKHFELTANIDMSDVPGNAYNIIGNFGHPFTGAFNGNGHTISNFSCVTNSSYVGLFGYVSGVNSRFTNLRLVNPHIDAGSGTSVGSLAGCVIEGTILDCSVENGYVNTAGSFVGGLVGNLSGSGNLSRCTVLADVNGQRTIGGLAGSLSIVISDCSADGNVTGQADNVGGFAGQAFLGSLSNCSSSGSVVAGNNAGGFIGLISGNPSGFDINNCHSNSVVIAKDIAGGFVGRIQSGRKGRITGCTSVAEVNTSGAGTAGGFAGFNDANISACSVSATVSGLDRIGGICGISIGRIDTSRFTGAVNGTSNVGGLVGYQDYSNTPSAIIDCYTEGQVVGNSNVGGLVGYNRAPLSNSFSACAVSGTSYVGGLAGYPYSYPPTNCVWDIEISEINKPCGTGNCEMYNNRGRTTEQMKSAYSFAAWACDSNWLIDNGNDYPRLYWESRQGGPILETIFPQGSGDLNAPFLIDRPQQLIALGWASCIQNRNFALTVDLDLADFNLSDFRSIGTGSYQVQPKGGCFTGTFDGQGHIISDFNYRPIYVPQQEYLGGGGIFGCLGDANAQIKNLGLVRPDINGGATRSQDNGPLAGYVSAGTISNCFSCDGNIVGAYGVGGLVGRLGSSNAKIIDSYSTTNAAATGGYAGGLVGYTQGGIIQRCYSAGEVNTPSSSKGGLVGVGSGTVSNSFWDINTSGLLTSAGGTGLTTEQMKTYSYYADAGWDFNNVWHICEPTNYPKLIWQLLSADYLCPDGVDFIDFSFLSAHWRQTDYGNCGGLDITGDGVVDMEDLLLFGRQWLQEF